MPRRYPDPPPRATSPRWRVEEVELSRTPDLQILDVTGEWRVVEVATGRCVMTVPYQSGSGFWSIPTEGPQGVYISGEDEAVVVWPTGRWERHGLPPEDGDEVVRQEGYRSRRHGAKPRG